MISIKKVTSFLKSYNTFALFTHISPDADALGSTKALKLALESLGKTVYVFCDGIVTKNLEFLGADLCTDVSVLENVEVGVLVDCNTPPRTGKYANDFEKLPVKMCIDHHIREKYRFNLKFVDHTSPSTCDLVYKIINGLKVRITKEIATLLYSGTATDTGCFKNTNTTAGCHRVAGSLIDRKFDLEMTNFYLFKFKPKKQMDFYEYCFKHLQYYDNDRILVVTVPYKEYKKVADVVETAGIFEFLTGIEGNEIILKIIEKEPKKYSVALRSNIYANVQEIASQFSGGGHKMASGCRFEGDYKSNLEKLLYACMSELDKHDRID